jgi:protein SCO1
MPTRRADRRRKNARRTNIIFFSGAAGLLLLTASYLWLLGGTTPRGGAVIGGPFTLTQGNGQVVTDRDFRGRYLLIYFGYTSCPDICPTTLSAIADAINILGTRAERLQPLFITVDPSHDTPAIVGAYVRSFNPRIIGLTGTPQEVRVVEQEYHVSSAVHDFGPGANNYSIDHTAVLFLMAPNGRFLVPFAATDTGAELAKKLAEYVG